MSGLLQRLLLGALVAALLVIPPVLPTPASAGVYSVRQCASAGSYSFDGVPSVFGGTDRVDFASGCSPGEGQQVGVHQDRSDRTMAEGVGGEYRWTAPDGARIVSTRFDVRMKDANGIKATPVGGRVSGTGAYLDAGQMRDGTRSTAQWADEIDPLKWVAARLVCRQSGSCANRPDSVKSFITVFDARFELRDSGYPVVTSPGIVRPGSSWLRGRVGASAEANDTGGGVAMLYAEVNGVIRPFAVEQVTCPGQIGYGLDAYAVLMQPCQAQVERGGQLDTTALPFREGSNRVKFCAEDFATGSSRSNRGCSPVRTVMVDNFPPSAPVGLQTVGGTDWRAINGFKFRWDEPEGQVAPIAGGKYRLLDRDTDAVVEEGDLGAETPGELGPLTLPGPGEYELELRLKDASGNIGAAAVATARFDDRPPGDVAPEAPSGWVSADELPLRQVVERAESGGPSGIGGYALAVSRDGTVAPCPSGLCLDPPIGLTGGLEDRIGLIPGLDEGRHWVSAVATSGAAVASEQPGSTPVDVDRTAPRVSLHGAPSGWSSLPVTVTATGTDELSGMLPRPGEDDGEPETVIQAEGLTPYRVPGAGASFTVTSEGVSTVRYWARDLAGNANDGERGPDGSRHPAPSEAVVRIDTEPPEPTFIRRRDPADPERIELVLRDRGSGPVRAGIGYRKAGSEAPFSPLATTAGNGEIFHARIHSDDLPAGSYELRATGTDRAGNVGSGDRAEDGSPMLLRLPLKRPTVLKAGFGWQRRQATTAGFAQRVLLTGRLTSGGSGLPGVPLVVTESLAVGSRKSHRITVVKTDGTGRFALRLRPGPGRRVTVLYEGTRTRSRTIGQSLRIGTRGRIKLSVRPTRVRNGGETKMKGRVVPGGALIPARGKLVAIQYFDPGRRRWRPVEVLRTNRNGRYSYRYRFRTIATAQRILFRAVALPEAGWPYLHSTSRPLSVIVFPRR